MVAVAVVEEEDSIILEGMVWIVAVMTNSTRVPTTTTPKVITMIVMGRAEADTEGTAEADTEETAVAAIVEVDMEVEAEVMEVVTVAVMVVEVEIPISKIRTRAHRTSRRPLPPTIMTTQEVMVVEAVTERILILEEIKEVTTHTETATGIVIVHLRTATARIEIPPLLPLLLLPLEGMGDTEDMEGETLLVEVVEAGDMEVTGVTALETTILIIRGEAAVLIMAMHRAAGVEVGKVFF